MSKQSNLSKELNNLLADYQIFYQNLRGLHWNIQGRHFFELHEKFEGLYTNAADKIDEIAERILTIGKSPLHTFEDYLSKSSIKPKKNISDGEAAVKTIVSNMESIIKKQKKIQKIADSEDDGGTADLMAAFIEEQEKTLWMYNAWLK